MKTLISIHIKTELVIASLMNSVPPSKPQPISFAVFSIFLLFALFTISTNVKAQTDKATIKEWKKKLRDMDPLDYKYMVESYQDLKTEHAKMSAAYAPLQKTNDSLQRALLIEKNTNAAQKAAYDKLLAKYEAEVLNESEKSSANNVVKTLTANSPTKPAATAKASAPAAPTPARTKPTPTSLAAPEVQVSSSSPTGLKGSQGVYFLVQIGAIASPELKQMFASSPIFVKDVDPNSGMEKIMLGMFRNFDTANELKDQLREMGVKAAWVVAYKDGGRVPVSSVR